MPLDALHPDVIVRAAAIHAFDPERHVHRSVAVRDGAIVALDEDVDGLDGLRGPRTRTVDCRHLTLAPAFFDTHNHMLAAGRDGNLVQLGDAGSLDEIVGRLAGEAERLPAGEWIVPSRNWHETNIAERRLPTAAELDRATAAHPIALRRGGHVMVANSAALDRVGIGVDTPDPDSGTIVRDAAGHPTGLLIERPAFESISRLLPQPTFGDQVDQLGRICGQYNERGIAAVRDPGLGGDDFRIYQEAADRGLLTVRTQLMLRLSPEWDVERMLAEIAAWPVRTGLGDDMLRLGGIKVFLDGGVEGAALSEPYANNPSYRGHLFLDTAELTTVVNAALDRGWEFGCHALGDRAVAAALDAYEAAAAAHPGLRPGHLVLEHACFADAETRRRAIDLGVGVCVQHPLLYFLGGNMVSYWGEERTNAVLPIRQWVEEGALVSAGSDHNITYFDPLKSIWGMVTRETASAGRRGIDLAVDRWTAFRLYTVAGAGLIGDARVGPLGPGRLADLIGFRDDPLSCPIDDLPQLDPAFTLLGGRAVHDPDGAFDGATT